MAGLMIPQIIFPLSQSFHTPAAVLGGIFFWKMHTMNWRMIKEMKKQLANLLYHWLDFLY